jgi:hypothetical protein
MDGSVSLNTVYTKYKNEFARSGKLDQDLSGSVNGTEYKSMFYVDYLVLLEISSDSRYLKEVQGALADAYGLGECNTKNAGVTQSEIGKTKGAFEYFMCIDGKSKDYNGLWEPIIALNDDNYDAVAAATSGENCNSKNEGKIVTFTFNGEKNRAVCSDDGVWQPSVDECSEEGEIWISVDSGTEYVFKCEKKENGKLVSKLMSDGRDEIEKLCNKTENVGKIYSVYNYEENDGHTDYYSYVICNGESSENEMIYRSLNLNDFEDVNLVANKLYGDCSAENEKTAKTIKLSEWHSYDNTESNINSIDLVCLNIGDGYKWHFDDETLAPTIQLGVCNEEKMKEDTLYRVDVLGQQKSTLTGYKYYKCDCEYCEQETCPQNVECSWKYASENEIKLDEACNYDNMGDFSKDGEYVCKIVDNDKHDWTKPNAEEWCNNGHWKFLNGVTKVLKVDDLTPGGEYEGPYAICDNVPEDITTYILTYSLCGSSTANSVGETTAEEYFYANCDRTPNFINDNLYNSIYTNGGERVHDFVCKKGNDGQVRFREAVDEQEACNAAFDKDELCKYMKEAYRFDATDGLWKKITAEEYCNEQLNNAYDGLQSCSTSEVNAFCSIEGNSGDGNAPCAKGEFWYRCTLPEALQDDGVYMDCQKEEDTYKWSSHRA